MVYTGAMVVHLSAEDMYPPAVPTKVVSLVDSERKGYGSQSELGKEWGVGAQFGSVIPPEVSPVRPSRPQSL